MIADAFPRLLRDVIVGLSGLVAGGTLYLAVVVNLREAIAGKHVAWFYFSARFGLAVVILLVAEAVFAEHEVPLTWRALAYVAALAMVGIGYIGIALDHRKRAGRGERAGGDTTGAP